MENIANESAYIALDKNRNIISDDDIKDAFLKILSSKETIV